jgi:hypothetical protein
MARGR